MIDKINNNKIPDLVENPPASQQKQAEKTEAENIEVSLQVDHAPLIEKAMQADTTDTNAVEQAKQLLESGQLDDPENIRSAAANILKFGI